MSEPSHESVKQFVKRKGEPFATTADVAEQFEKVSERTIRERLKDLVKAGELRAREIGPSAKVWYPPRDEKREQALSRRHR